MACPNCKMNLGWATPAYKDEKVPWYKYTDQVVDCKYCGARFESTATFRGLQLVACVTVIASMYVANKFGFDDAKQLITMLVTLGLFLVVLALLKPKYKMIQDLIEPGRLCKA